jgi:hypothetical protein
MSLTKAEKFESNGKKVELIAEDYRSTAQKPEL